jgi:hypothetical protein
MRIVTMSAYVSLTLSGTVGRRSSVTAMADISHPSCE